MCCVSIQEAKGLPDQDGTGAAGSDEGPAAATEGGDGVGSCLTFHCKVIT
jgi:hypothetical protein